MKKFFSIAVLAAILIVVSLSGFSQKTCALRINDDVSGASYSAVAYLVNVTTNPIAIMETVPDPTVYLDQTNDIPFTYNLPPTQFTIWMYYVEVTRTNPEGFAVGYSSLFNTSTYNSDDIPVVVNF